MDESRLARLREELEKARRKRDEWEAKVKDLERRYKEAENTCIHNMVHAANLTPEQLAELIRRAASGIGGALPLPDDNASADDAESQEKLFDDLDEETGNRNSISSKKFASAWPRGIRFIRMSPFPPREPRWT